MRELTITGFPALLFPSSALTKGLAILALVLATFLGCDSDRSKSENDTTQNELTDSVALDQEQDSVDDLEAPEASNDLAEVDSVELPELVDDLIDSDLADSVELADAELADVVDTDLAEVGVSACTGACAQTQATAVFGAVSQPFDRGVYGLTSLANSDTGQWELYLEVYAEGDPGCPSAQSATPLATLILSGVPQSAVPTTVVSSSDGLVVTLLDFNANLLAGSPLASASDAVFTVEAVDTCTACVGEPDPSDTAGFVSFELSATFADGTLSGHVYATHCDSLDWP